MDKIANRLTTAKSIRGRLWIALVATAGLSSAAVAHTEPSCLGLGRTKSISSSFIPPFANARVTSGFNQGRRHPAIDLAGPIGTPVVATTSSQRVSFAGPRGGYGNTVMTQDAQGRTHLYAHLQSVSTRVGLVLVQGQKLGALGSTGYSTGPHVHYEVRNTAGLHVDPAPLLFPQRIATPNHAYRGNRLSERRAILARTASF